MTTQAEQDYYELFPSTYQDSHIDDIINFRQSVIETYPIEISKLAPSKSLLNKGIWPWKKDGNSGKELSEVNDYYLTAILYINIYCTPTCAEYDEVITKGIIRELFNRKPYLVTHYLGWTIPRIRDSLVASYRPSHTPRLGYDKNWPLKGHYYGKELSKIPPKVLISTLQSNAYCNPQHKLFNIEITQYIIDEIQRLMGNY